MINNNLSSKHNTLIMYRLCIGQRVYSGFFLLFYFVYTLLCLCLQIYSVRWIEHYRKGQATLVENMYLAGKRKKKKANEASANKQK